MGISSRKVGEYFKNKQLDSSGYSVAADVSQLKGLHSLSLAYEHNAAVNICAQFNILGDFKGD